MQTTLTCLHNKMTHLGIDGGRLGVYDLWHVVMLRGKNNSTNATSSTVATILFLEESVVELLLEMTEHCVCVCVCVKHE